MANQYRRWSQEDLTALHTLFADGFTDEEIARAMNRSKKAVCTRRYFERLTRIPHRPWTVSEEKRVTELFYSGAHIVKIARELERTPQAVLHKLEELRKRK